jgi:hypothetical protein
MFKKAQNKCIDKTELLLRKSGLPDKTIHQLLTGFHIFLVIITIVIILFGTKHWCYFIILFNISILLLFLLLDGCILSRIERRFSDTEFNILDPILTLLGKRKIHENKYTYSIVINIFIDVILIMVYQIRFGRLTNIKSYPPILNELLSPHGHLNETVSECIRPMREDANTAKQNR